MNALAVLDKFETVEITNESRITGEELKFCTAQQALYEKVLAQHRHVFGVLQELKNECHAFIKAVAGDNEYQSHGNTYNHYGCDYVTLDKEDFANKYIGEIHERFISIIISFFTEKYSVSIDIPEYKTILGLKEPESPDHRFLGYYRDLSDDEIEKLKAQRQGYEDAKNNYFDTIINARLDYNDMLDHIFLKLNGRTFAERAEQEIKEGSRRATKKRWRNTVYEIKNKRIIMSILYPRKNWRDEYEVSLDGEGYRAILRALTYFNSGKRQTDIYSGWQRFIGYSQYESDGIFDLHQVGSTKVLSFKYYKNGKFEITFDAHITAQQFATEYLYNNEEEGDD